MFRTANEIKDCERSWKWSLQICYLSVRSFLCRVYGYFGELQSLSLKFYLVNTFSLIVTACTHTTIHMDCVGNVLQKTFPHHCEIS